MKTNVKQYNNKYYKNKLIKTNGNNIIINIKKIK